MVLEFIVRIWTVSLKENDKMLFIQEFFVLCNFFENLSCTALHATQPPIVWGTRTESKAHNGGGPYSE
jgi:hypothetical protein